MNWMKCEEKDNDDITNDIKKNETNIVWSITGEKRWKRKCPKCSNTIYYNFLHSFNRATTRNAICNKCRQIKYNSKMEWKRKCECGREIIYKQKSHFLRAKNQNRKCSDCCNDHENDIGYKKKQRIARINYLQKTYHFQAKPVFNIDACGYFDKLSKEKGWNLQHALNGGEHYIKELGYWIDAYDKDENVVVEYDESRHYNKNGDLRKRDIDRMNEICNNLKCRFYRYNEIKDTLNEYTINNSTTGNV